MMGVPRLKRCERGGAMVELALVLPILVLLLLGTVEATRYALLHLKLETVAGTVADLIARETALTTTSVDAILTIADDLASPFDLRNQGLVVLTSVSPDGKKGTRINWQRSGGGGLTAVSQVGSGKDSANLPAGFTLDTDETAIVAEVFFKFQPLLAPDLFPPKTLTQTALVRPRIASLTTLAP